MVGTLYRVPTQIYLKEVKFIMSQEFDDLKDKLRLSRIINIILIVTIFALGGYSVYDHNANMTEQDELKISNADLKETVSTIAFQKDEEYKDIAEDNVRLSTDIAILSYMNTVLSEENESLCKSNDDYYNDLYTLYLRSELYDKYEYAIVNKEGVRTDISYDQLILLEDLCENTLVDDPDLYLAWIMVESGGVEKARNSESTASGYGQFLNSTSKWVYNNLCDFDTPWSANAAYDGNTNITMMVAYVNYLYESTDGNLLEAIDKYRGLHSDAYIAKIDSYLATKGKSVNSIAIELSNSFDIEFDDSYEEDEINILLASNK